MSRFKKAFKTFFLVDMLQGLWVTLKYYFSPKVTISYPEKVKTPAERFKGILRLFRDESGDPLCIACKACQRICPTNCFDIEGIQEEGQKRMKPAKFDWKLERCTFCGLCVEVCPTAAIRFSREFRMTVIDRTKTRFQHPEMYLAGDDLQKYFCEGCRR
jgi:NADH-quinone oxidoreductase subunit I